MNEMRQMEKITAQIKILNWTDGNVYGMEFRLSGETPAVRMDWGDGCVKTYYGNNIDREHTYFKGAGHIYAVEATILDGTVDYVNPTGGDCEYLMIDFSGAPSIREIYAEMTTNVMLDNPNLTKLKLRINKGHHYDFSRCPNLTDLSFSGECPKLDLSHNHKLERLSWTYRGWESRRITFANDAPLQLIHIQGKDVHPGCMAALHRILESSGGRMTECVPYDAGE